MKYRNQACTIPDDAFVDHRQQPVPGHPRHVVGLVEVGSWAEVYRTSSDEDEVLRVSDADRRLKRERLLVLLRTPTGLLTQLPDGCACGVLRWLDYPYWKLPAPAVVDEAVTVKHQQLSRVVDQEHDRDPLHSQHMVFETDSTRGLDINEVQVHPPALVQRPRAEHPPPGSGPAPVGCSHVVTLPRRDPTARVVGGGAPARNHGRLAAAKTNIQRRSCPVRVRECH